MISPSTLPVLTTPRTCLTLLAPFQADLMARFRCDNQEHLVVWEPRRTKEFYTEAFWQMQLRLALRDFRQGQSVSLAILNPEASEVLGVCNYSNIVRGTFQSCHLGYALAQRWQGQGIMFEALQASLTYIFNDLHLHRVMANYLPHNQRSGDLLQRLGFKVEGRAEKLLMINGRWEDHVLTSLINPVDR
ncbi:MAG: ribosomal-protein-alanine N-acetyltransferase [Candidatus Azotimanducaceae bacterium]|jgi:ribosomal-protein-alanine N-acetyltransferase